MDSKILTTAKQWLGEGYDAATKAEVKKMIDGDPKVLEDAFYKTLEFGTGGLRGIMGAGTNRMNRYTVGMATQGFANYLIKAFGSGSKNPIKQIKVAISFDCRNHSKEYSKLVADIFAANGFKVFLFRDLRPTPELSYTIRRLHCQGGVMVTASHNPKEYNGYKAYWDDGAQVIAPHDTGIIKEVNKIKNLSQVKWGSENKKDARNCAGVKACEKVSCKGSIKMIGAEIDKAYLKDLSTLHLSPLAVKHNKNMKVVYTPLHGTGIKIIPRALREMGFTNVNVVKVQAINDGNFPTVESPNPENPSAMKMAVDLANKIKADLVLASDPDADRVGMGIRNDKGEIVLLNGNQTNSILTYYVLRRWSETGKLKRSKKFPYTIKTIVTTNLISDIAEKFGVKCYNVLTGFKNIAEVVKHNEGKGIFVCGGEESFGFSLGEFVRDKDAPITCSILCECAAWCADNRMTMWGLLQEIYRDFGKYEDWLCQYTFKGIEGAKKIAGIMEKFRNNPPKKLAGSPIVVYKDFNKGSNYAPEVKLAKSNVLQYIAKDGTMVSLRPSGTEPKIKFYFETRCKEGEDSVKKKALLDKEFLQK